MKDKTGKFLLAIVPVVAVVVGSYLTLWNAQSLFLLQRHTELRQRSYAKLMGLKVDWMQIKRRHLESSLQTQIAEARYRNISHAAADLQLQNRLVEETNRLIDRVAGVQREVFETIGEIRVAYDNDITPCSRWLRQSTSTGRQSWSVV